MGFLCPGLSDLLHVEPIQLQTNANIGSGHVVGCVETCVVGFVPRFDAQQTAVRIVPTSAP